MPLFLRMGDTCGISSVIFTLFGTYTFLYFVIKDFKNKLSILKIVVVRFNSLYLTIVMIKMIKIKTVYCKNLPQPLKFLISIYLPYK